jgi:hypothetical protein
MNLKILPAPTWWFALLYFVPTILELYVVYVWWRRVPSYAVADQPRIRSNVLGTAAFRGSTQSYELERNRRDLRDCRSGVDSGRSPGQVST